MIVYMMYRIIKNTHVNTYSQKYCYMYMYNFKTGAPGCTFFEIPIGKGGLEGV